VGCPFHAAVGPAPLLAAVRFWALVDDLNFVSWPAQPLEVHRGFPPGCPPLEEAFFFSSASGLNRGVDWRALAGGIRSTDPWVAARRGIIQELVEGTGCWNTRGSRILLNRPGSGWLSNEVFWKNLSVFAAMHSITRPRPTGQFLLFPQIFHCGFPLPAF